MTLIGRFWFGRTPVETSEEYLDYVRQTGFKDLIDTRGNRGVLLLQRPVENGMELGVVSFWESFGAIRQFAGDREEKAVYYPKDSEYLMHMDPEVVHYDVPVLRGVTFRNGSSSGTVEAVRPDQVQAETPFPGVRIRRLWTGCNGAKALVVEIDAGHGWPDLDVHEPGPEEVYVVSGVFSDGQTDYPAGSFVHNPAGSSHVPQTSSGCVLFVFYPEG